VIVLPKKQDSTDEPTETTNEPSLTDQFETLVARKVFLWDSIKDGYTNPYDYSFRQTDGYREIQTIDLQLFEIQEKMKEVV
jgi:hypothetical protein